MCGLLCELMVRGLPRVRWGAGSLLVVATATATTLPNVISAIAGTRALVFDPASKTLILVQPWEDTLNRVFLYGLTAVTVAVLLLSVRRRLRAAPAPRPGWHATIRLVGQHQLPAVLAVFLWCATVLGAVRAGDSPFRLQNVALVAVLLAAVVTVRDESVPSAVAVCVLVIAAVSAGLGALRPDQAFRPCVGKCYLSSELLTGVFANENALGIALAMCIPFVWMAFAGWRAWYACALIFAVLLATGSRTGEVAAAITIVALAVSRARLSRADSKPWALVGSVAISSAVGLVIPFLALAPADFTGRAKIWSIAREHLNVWLGSGPFRWNLLRGEIGQIPAAGTYSVHNQWLDVLFQAGLVGLLLFGGLLVAMCLRSRLALSLAVMLPLTVIGITERPWSPSQVDWLSFTYVAALLFIAKTSWVDRVGHTETQVTAAL